jgi:hypothetical protein
MTKRKRTYEEVEAMQKKAVRFQESLDHLDAARRLDELTPEQYATLRKIEITGERPHGYGVEVNEWIEGGVKHRVVKKWKTLSTSGKKKGSKK